MNKLSIHLDDNDDHSLKRGNTFVPSVIRFYLGKGNFQSDLFTFAAMLYRLTAFLMIPLLLGVSLSRMAVFAGFEMNRSYIASKLCENRDKAWMHCEGKCYLAKKLRQVEEKEKKQEQETQKQLVQDSFLPESFIVFFGNTITTIVDTPYYSYVSSGYEASFFQPPQV